MWEKNPNVLIKTQNKAYCNHLQHMSVLSISETGDTHSGRGNEPQHNFRIL